ncbi:Uncharacterised protein [Enterobacter cloacae]|nr:Uncharacterised protein [Enterobacter cloacae]
MLRRGAAAAADDVEETRFGPFADLRRHGVGIQIVLTKRVRQTGVRVGGDVALCDARKLLHVLAQLVRPQRTVEAKGERFGVAQGVIKRFGCLAGKCAPRGVGDGAGNHDRQVDAQRLELLFHRVNRGFSVEGVEYGFNQDQVGAAFHQRFSGLTIRGHQLVKGDVPKRRVVDVRRNRRGAVGWAQHPGYVARLVRRTGRPFVGAGARQLRRFKVDLRRQGFHLVIRHGDGCRVEGVGFNNIRTRFEVSVVDIPDNRRFA